MPATSPEPAETTRRKLAAALLDSTGSAGSATVNAVGPSPYSTSGGAARVNDPAGEPAYCTVTVSVADELDVPRDSDSVVGMYPVVSTANASHVVLATQPVDGHPDAFRHVPGTATQWPLLLTPHVAPTGTPTVNTAVVAGLSDAVTSVVDAKE